MKKVILLLAFAPLLMASMCEDNDDKLPCTLEAVYGLNITVQDAATGEYFSYATGIQITDGDYSDNLSLFPGSVPPTYSGALERPGTYTITVTKTGYLTYVSDPITVTSDDCHVIPQTIAVQLTAE